MYMSPLVTDARAWVPSSSGVFSVKSFFLALTNLSDSVPFYPTKFLWKLVLGTQYPRLFKVVLDKNIPISSVLGPTRPFSWNLNFRRNLSDYEIEDLEGLMRSLDDCIYLIRFQMPDFGHYLLQGFFQSNLYF